jgi:hypothetical protein
MAHDVFISFSTEDKAIADAACAILEARRIRCWIAPRDVQPGIAYPQSIMEGIRGARVLVLILSAKSNTSKHVMREVERAVNCEIPVVPVRIEDVSLSGSMEYLVGSLHWLDALTPPLERHLETLARRILALLAESGSGEASARPPSGKDVLNQGRVDSAATTEAGPSLNTTAADDPTGSQRPNAAGRAAETHGRPSCAPPKVPESPVWRNPRLTWILGTLHLLCGVTQLLLLSGAFLVPHSPPNLLVVLFSILTPSAALQAIGGYGLWRKIPWSGWLACVGAGQNSAFGLLSYFLSPLGRAFISENVELVDVALFVEHFRRFGVLSYFCSPLGSGAFFSVNTALFVFHLWLRPKIVARRSVRAANPAAQYPQPRS